MKPERWQDTDRAQAARLVCERLWTELHEAWETDDDINGADTVDLLGDLRELIAQGAGVTKCACGADWRARVRGMISKDHR